MLIGKVQRQCLGEDERKRTDLGEEETVKDKRRKEESFVFNKKYVVVQRGRQEQHRSEKQSVQANYWRIVKSATKP